MRTGAEFEGMDPWPFDAGIIECEGTALGLIDLHNDCDVAQTVIGSRGPDLEIVFRLVGTGVPVRLSLAGAELVRVDVENAGDADVFHGVDHYPCPVTGRSMFEFDVGTLTIVVRADKVVLEVGRPLSTGDGSRTPA